MFIRLSRCCTREEWAIGLQVTNRTSVFVIWVGSLSANEWPHPARFPATLLASLHGFLLSSAGVFLAPPATATAEVSRRAGSAIPHGRSALARVREGNMGLGDAPV